MAMHARQPAVAGTFYPGQRKSLQDAVEQLLAASGETEQDFDPEAVRAIVVPHAGYIFSGTTAAAAYNLIGKIKRPIRRVVLLGPSHRVPLRGIALPDESVFTTPLGDIPLDVDTLASLRELPGVQALAEAHQWEHSLEVQLPFLQSVLRDFVLVPLVVGQCDPQTVATLLEKFWHDTETLIVISSDLSHYLSYAEAQRQDRQTSELIEAKALPLHGEQACGCNPLNGLLKVARDHKLTVTTLNLCNSGDTAGDRDRVVGYGAYAFYE